jgi:hypothetical protein
MAHRNPTPRIDKTAPRTLMDEFAELARATQPHRDRRRSRQAGVPNFTYGWPLGGSETVQMLRDADWSCCTLGPPPGWPLWLRVATGLLLDLPLPGMMLVGVRYVQFYNDACLKALGSQYRLALGEPIECTSQNLWLRDGPIYDRVLHKGEAVIVRAGNRDTGLVTDSYSPVRDEGGSTRAVLWLMSQPESRPIATA